MLSRADIETIGRLTNYELFKKWDGLSRKFAGGSKITIANTGLYSSGKSSLFNAILGRVREDNMRFAVAAPPITRTGDREPLIENIELLDTPGIDANFTDDATAFDMLMEADIILMTHNVKRGMLDRPEYDWLKRIAGGISRETLAERLIFVSTWIETIDNDEDREKLRAEIKRQVLEAVNGIEIRFFEVSAKRYKTGVEKDKAGLQNASGIPELRELVISAGKNYSEKAAALRRKEVLRLCSESREQLNARKREISSEIESKKKRVKSRYSGAFEKWRGILGRFSSMRAGVSSKLQEVYNASENASEYQGFRNSIYSM